MVTQIGPTPLPPPDGKDWTMPNWTTLKPGMTSDEVYDCIGAPTSLSIKKDIAVWTYDKKKYFGTVLFSPEMKLTDCKIEPKENTEDDV